ncbi:MAG: hypothetical protein K2X82_12495 [Gemmataceae bacterium]|nr:hypothetical protein [Gemmataceae bacterium]
MRRTVRLIDARRPDRPYLAAALVRDFPAGSLAAVEAAWAAARARADAAAGPSGLEHGHWDWRNKVRAAQSGAYHLVAVEAEAEVQGLMAVDRRPRPARRKAADLLYVDYLETAPWNLKVFGAPWFVGVGTALLIDAVRLSLDGGLGGRVGLHSLGQAEPFYARCRMAAVGPDPGYHGLTYFEYTDGEAVGWLTALGELP